MTRNASMLKTITPLTYLQIVVNGVMAVNVVSESLDARSARRKTVLANHLFTSGHFWLLLCGIRFRVSVWV